MPRIIGTLFAALLALAILPSLRAQQLLKPQSVRFDETQEYSPDELSAVTGVKKGATYTADFLAQGARSYKLGSVQIASGLPVTLNDVSKMLSSRDRFTPETRYAAAVRGAAYLFLKSKGYLDCTVTLTPSIDENAGTADYTIHAVPGPVYHLGLLKFENVSDDMRALLMRSWQMMPGDPFNESYVGNFITIAQKSDPALQRSLVGVKVSYDVRSDPETRDVNVIIRLERP